MLHKRPLILFLVFVNALIYNFLIADQPSSKVLEVARSYANYYYGGKIVNAVPYYGPGKGDIVWVFTVFKRGREIPSNESIQTMVAQARTKRILAESDLEYAIQIGEKKNIKEAQERIKQAYSEMRNEDDFATIYVADYQNGFKVITKIRYHGLPLNYTAFLDAEKKVKNTLKAHSVSFERYLYFNSFTI